jgi:uncharacterized protein DUF3417
LTLDAASRARQGARMGQPADASSDGFEELRELALNLRSVWNHRTDSLWERIDRELWELPLITWARG